MSKSEVISKLLFLREQYKSNFDNQLNIGDNWSITVDSNNVLHIKHLTGGADVSISDTGSFTTNGSIGTTSGLMIGGDNITYIPEYTITETEQNVHSAFVLLTNTTIAPVITNNTMVQYFDAATCGNYLIHAANVPASNDMIYLTERTNGPGIKTTFNPIGNALGVKVNGVAINHTGTTFAALLALQYMIDGRPTWGTYLYIHTLGSKRLANVTNITIDATAQYTTTQFMFSDNEKYISIGLPGYNNGVGSILVYSVNVSGAWSLTTSVFPSSGGTHVGFGAMMFISDDGQYILGRHSFGGAPDAKSRVYIFEKSTTSAVWNQSATIEEPSGSIVDTLFGFRAAITSDGNTMFVSDEAWGTNQGRIVSYIRDTHTKIWTINQSIVAADGVAGDRFGKSIETRGKYTAIAAPKTSGNVIYIFANSNGRWLESHSVANPAAVSNNPFHMKLCQYEFLFTTQLGTSTHAYQTYQGTNTYADVAVHTNTIVPNNNNTYDFGTPALAWRDIYSVNAPTVVSEEAAKQNIQDCKLGINFIRELNPITFNWKGDIDYADHDGFIAQDVMALLPDGDIVAAGPTMGMRYNELIAPLTSAIRDLDTRISKLEISI